MHTDPGFHSHARRVFLFIPLFRFATAVYKKKPIRSFLRIFRFSWRKTALARLCFSFYSSCIHDPPRLQDQATEADIIKPTRLSSLFLVFCPAKERVCSIYIYCFSDVPDLPFSHDRPTGALFVQP